MTNMATFDTSSLRSNAKYRVMEPGTQTGLHKVKGVFGLGSCVYNNKLYYFFGGLGFHRTLQVRLCSEQVLEFDPKTRDWKEIHFWHKPDRHLTERRYVTTLLIGKHFLCLGGINKQGYGLKDFICIDMETKQWQELPITNPSDGPGYLYSCAMCLVAYKEREVLGLHKLSDIKWDLVTSEIRLEGIYVFGGVRGQIPDVRV